jgi:hypothetical protein
MTEPRSLGIDRPRWIIVVRRDRAELRDQLRRSFARAAWVEVVLDRRTGDRRRESGAAATEARAVERRGRAGDRGQRAAYRLGHRGDGFEVYEATALVPATCSDCGGALSFEMPRFAEPPARLDLRVVHESSHGRSGRHVVELQSFSATGRPLLASRITARPAPASA